MTDAIVVTVTDVIGAVTVTVVDAPPEVAGFGSTGVTGPLPPDAPGDSISDGVTTVAATDGAFRARVT